ncbi:MAG: phosphoglucosamine mutase [Myxococcota bacterium]|jgi:phosphoglucosamine mutase
MKFGTDGVRGPAGVWPIDAAGAERIGAVATRLGGPGARVVVARDTRPSGPGLAAAVCAAVQASGGHALDAGVLPTPAVSLAVQRGLADVGVMITASHNDAPDNGFKLFTVGGRKLTADETTQVESWLAHPILPADGGSISPAPQVREQYVSALHDVLDVDLSGKTIAVDMANGAALALAGDLASLCGATVVQVAAGDGDINAGCGAVHPERLAETVRLQELDGGFAVDGDSDRCLLVTEEGVVVPGDALILRLAQARKVSGLAVTVMSNAALESQLPGVQVVRTPVGDKHLQVAMAKQGLPLGGEESGHVLFDDWPGGDGLLTGFRALAACFDGAETVSQAMASYVAFPRDLSKFSVANKPPLEQVAGLDDKLAQWESELNGGRVFIRYSGTESVVRILVEGPEDDVVQRIAHASREWLGQALA